MLPSNSSNRIKLNRNAFRLESGSAPKRRRAVGEPRDPLLGTDPALTGCGPRASSPPNAREPVREPPGDTSGGTGEGALDPFRCGVTNDTNNNDTVSENPTQPQPISCHLSFALRFSDAKNATRKPSTGPGTVACYVNGKVCVESSLRFGPAEPSGLDRTPEGEQRVVSPVRRGRGTSRCTRSSGDKPTPDTQIKPPWTRASTAEASNFNKKSKGKKCFDLVTRFGSGRHVKRSVRNPCCALCGDVKYTAPVHNNPAGLRKPRLRFPGLPRRREVAKVRPAAAQAKQKGTLIIWFKEYPRVNLCDIARVFDVTSHDFSCVLPVVMHQNWDQKRDHKSVPCLKTELRSLMQHYSSDDSKWIGSQISKVCAPTNRCPSLSSGERDSGTTEDQSVLDTALVHDDDCPETSENPVSKMFDHKRMRLTSFERTPCLPIGCGDVLHPDKTNANFVEGSAMASVCQEETMAPVPRLPPLVPECVTACNGFGSPQSYHLTCKPSVDHKNSTVGESDALHSRLNENGMSEDSDEEVCSPHSFSCQRTQAYLTWTRFSCARTCRSWPFPRRGPPAEMKSAVRTGPRWITTSRTADSTDQTVSDVQPGLQPKMTHDCITGKNVRYCPVRIQGSSNEQRLNKMETIPEEVQEAPAEPREHQKETGKAASSDPSMKKDGTIGKNMRDCLFKMLGSSIKGLVDQKEQGQTSSTQLNKMETDGDSEQKLLPLAKFLEGTENVERLETFQALESIKDCGLKQRTQQTSPSNLSRLHPREDSCTTSTSSSPSKMVCSSVEPQASSLVPIKKHGSISPVENTTDPLYLLSALNPVSSPSKSNSKQSEDETSSPSSSPASSSLSSSGEDNSTSNCSPVQSSEESEVDAECSSLQDELCESGRTNSSPSPSRSPEFSIEAADDMDVLRAYEEDAIILDVIQDDPDLFGVVETAERLTQTQGQVALKKGYTVSLQPEKTSAIGNRNRIVWSEPESPRKLTADCRMGNSFDFHTVDISEPSQGSVTQLGRSWLPLKSEQTYTDYNNNLGERYSDMNADNVLNSTGSSRLVIDSGNSVRSTAGSGFSAPRSSSVQYCYYYFSEHYTCRKNFCRYLHSAKAEDEKFCMDTVLKFCRAGNPFVLHRAVAVLVEYYMTNSPGVSYNQSIVNSLLSCLLNLALIGKMQSVINTLLTHKKTPPPDLIMALYERVRERGLLKTVPELILLTSKIIDAGCVFTVNQCEMMQSQLQMLQVPGQQMEIFQAVKCRALATNPQTAEVSVLAQAVVQVEMYKEQENWSELARVFCRVCNGHYSAGEVTRFCCCITVVLMTESKDKLTLPFEPFAESICEKEPPGGLVRSFLGRVGVSLMFKYYRILDWAKGMKVVLAMSRLHVEFSTLKGLFSSEEWMSRCKLITTATELFLNSGSIEGALNVLRADEWFVSSSVWPCEAGDVENRKKVLTQLAGKTSYRDTLEVLSNLPGLSKPLDGVQVGEYCSVFNTHLRKCVMNQVLPVAADTLEFMLTQGIPPDTTQLQNVIHKLGKQNNWNRARALFKRARSAGHYSEVGCGTDSLALPCCLNEIEMTLAFEMFITGVGATFQNFSDPSQPLLITLKRTSSGEAVMESRYLAAGCCMLSAAKIPNPKLSIRYMAVNKDQEQIFHLDRGSAAKWLSHNYTWAQEMWAS
ncbi:testis- and ovary-specific PAZ domain-containing protein 1 isoform X1 [Astyanax mexicanus]|uniref:Protein TOPAZ1 n=1 Tax=Astyanax mexicanus TaxID=7994 RepID=A0A8B9JR96_ASTMX|nr:testis- and ovary-specific PAZ domain-containing protein 1 isoform X1 [Astyanax mexicanus]